VGPNPSSTATTIGGISWANLQTPYLAEVARSTSAAEADTQFTIDFGAPYIISGICFGPCNVRPDALCRYRAYDDNGLVYDSGLLQFPGSTVDSANLEWEDAGFWEGTSREFDDLFKGIYELAGDLSTFADDLVLGGQKLSDAFASLSKTLGSGSLKALLTGEGPLAGILGTQSAEKGQIGGLLGGKLDFGGLFNSDKIADALGVGAETGLGKSISSWLKETKLGSIAKKIFGSSNDRRVKCRMMPSSQATGLAG
jgi:hypothetical protein